MKSRSSLQFILTGNFILIALFPVLIFGVATLLLMSKSLTEEINNKNFSLATSIASEVEVFLREPLSLIQQVVEVVSTPGVLSENGVDGYLETVVENYPFFEMVQILDSDGRVRKVAPYEEDYIGTDMSRQEFYKETIENKKPSWSSTFISMRTGSPTLSLSIPTGNSGISMIVGYVNLAVLSKMIEKISDSHQYVIITDRIGTVIANNISRRVQQRDNIGTLDHIRESVIRSENTFITTDLKMKVIASVVPVSLTDWKVFFLQHYDDALAPVTKIRYMLLFGIVLTGILAAFSAFLGAKRISKPFIRLVEDVHRVAEGDYTLVSKKDGFKELEELDESFRKMAEAISQREQSILESEQVHRELVEALPHGIQENDLDGIITFTNSAYDRIFEAEKGEAIGQPIWRTEISSAQKLRLQEKFKLIVDEQPPPVPHTSKAKTYRGNQIDIQIDWQYKRNQSGELIGFISVLTDITEKKVLESHLRQAQKMEAIGTLAGGIAHDFNNILSVILGYSELIMSTKAMDAKSEEYQQHIVSASLRARDLVQHLLIFSRKKEHAKGQVDIYGIVAEAVKFLRATLPTTISFELDLEEKTGTIVADATQIHQVVFNLCTNAAHAMEKSGGGVLTVSLSSAVISDMDVIRIKGLEPGNYARLAVCDTGEGISEKDIARIFDPFFTTKETGKGTGMGLAVVHGIVSSHSGVINVSSEMGKGTVFEVWLPLVEKRLKPKVTGISLLTEGRGHLLIVDDEEDIARISMLLLQDVGYQVTACNDSKEAYALVEREPEKFDLMITDQTMPGMTGIELSKKVAALRPDMPILLCSGYSSTLTDKQVAEAGVWKTVLKPVDRDALLTTVTALLAK